MHCGCMMPCAPRLIVTSTGRSTQVSPPHHLHVPASHHMCSGWVPHQTHHTADGGRGHGWAERGLMQARCSCSMVIGAGEVAWLIEQLWAKLGQPIALPGGQGGLLRQVSLP